uniref:Uncharacterized protein n=1 Tax=Arundo donax TaxID=35708 RepID=A0A0A9HSN7_ARUDO
MPITFSPNKTSPLLRVCDPVSSHHLAFTPYLPSSPPPPSSSPEP